MKLLGLIACALSLGLAQAVNAAEYTSEPLSVGEHYVVLDGLRFYYVVAGKGPLVVVQAPGWGIGSQYHKSGASQDDLLRTHCRNSVTSSFQTGHPVCRKAASRTVENDQLRASAARRYSVM